MPVSPMPAAVELPPYPGGVLTASEILRRQDELYERVWKQLAVDKRLLPRQSALEATIRKAVAMSAHRLALQCGSKRRRA
jgi:hypothetical protein